MWLKDIMQKNVVTALPSDPIELVARKMAEQKIGSVLIVGNDKKIQGIVTDRDIALAVAAEGRNPKTTFASELMSRQVLCAEIGTDLETALQKMNSAHARRLPVTDHGNLVGIVSSTDLACALKDQMNQFFGLEESYLRH